MRKDNIFYKYLALAICLALICLQFSSPLLRADAAPVPASRLSSSGLMIQVSTLAPTVTPQKLKTYLETIRLNHRDPSKSEFVSQIVLQDIADKNAALYKPYLDVIAPYLPGGATPAFDRAYVGTVDIAWTGRGSKYMDGIKNVSFRNLNVSTSLKAAQTFRRLYPKVVFDWYITYEANLNGFWDKKLETAYLTYINQLVVTLNSVSPSSNPLWSPAFWTSYSQQPTWSLPDLQKNLVHLFSNTSSKLVLDVQDFIGQSNGVFTKEDVVSWNRYLKSNVGTLVDGVKVNVEQFKMSKNGSLTNADSAEMKSRTSYYKTMGADIGPSWEIRFWYKRLYGA